MNANSKKTISLAALALVVAGASIVGFSVSSTASAQENNKGMHRYDRLHRVHVYLNRALKEQDFKLWQEVAEGTPLEDLISTRAQFDQLIEAHRLLQDGQLEEARALFEGLGITRPFHGQHHHQYAHGMQFLLQMSDADVTKLEKARTLYTDGEIDDARAIIRELREQY